jgi:hypothetical protein
MTSRLFLLRTEILGPRPEPEDESSMLQFT